MFRRSIRPPTISQVRPISLQQTDAPRHAIRGDVQAVRRQFGHSLRFYLISGAMVLGVVGMWFDAALDWGDGPPPMNAELGQPIPALRDAGRNANRYAERHLLDATL
jgi:hypothetical protein